MDSLSGVTLGLSLIGLILLVGLLVAIFYKPPKKLSIISKFRKDDNINKLFLVITVENTGKKRVRIVGPYIKFSGNSKPKLYQVNHKSSMCKFPKMIKIGDQLSCEIDISYYLDILNKKSFKPTGLKVYIEDTAGLQFHSQTHQLDI